MAFTLEGARATLSLIPAVITHTCPLCAPFPLCTPDTFACSLAMGGEFGAAMVYLHEIADPRYTAVTGSLGYVSLGVGVVIGESAGSARMGR